MLLLGEHLPNSTICVDLHGSAAVCSLPPRAPPFMMAAIVRRRMRRFRAPELSSRQISKSRAAEWLRRRTKITPFVVASNRNRSPPHARPLGLHANGTARLRSRRLWSRRPYGERTLPRSAHSRAFELAPVSSGLHAAKFAGVPEVAVAAAMEYEAVVPGRGMSFPTILRPAEASAMSMPGSRARVPRRGSWSAILVLYSRIMFAIAPERACWTSFGRARSFTMPCSNATGGDCSSTTGVTCAQVDGAAAGVLRKRKLARYFTHRPGMV